MGRDREPRASVPGESGDDASKSGSTESAVSAGSPCNDIATTTGQTTAGLSASKSTETTRGDGGDTTTAVPPDKPKRFAAKEDDGVGPAGRLAGPPKKDKAASDLVRNRIASAVWLIAVAAAVVLSVGALLIALGAREQNTVVAAVLDAANDIDGPFWRIFDFYEENKQGARIGPDVVKNHLVNWGLAAVAYLIGGWVLDRAIRP